MKRVVSVSIGLVTLYALTVIYGHAPSRSACGNDADSIGNFARTVTGAQGEFLVRRVFSRPLEWVPFQSTFVVACDGRDIARITLRRYFWGRAWLSSWYVPHVTKPNLK